MRIAGTHSASYGAFLLLFLALKPPPTTALIEDALDVIHVVKEVTVGILKAWDIVQQSPLAKNIEFPLMREKQRKVLQRLKEVSRQIEQTELKYAQNVALAIESVNAFVSQNTPLMAKMNDITDTMNRISSRFQQMQKYEARQDKLEMSTLVTFAEWTVSPNAYSVHHLMDRLQLTLLGQEEKENQTTNVLTMLAQSYEYFTGRHKRPSANQQKEQTPKSKRANKQSTGALSQRHNWLVSVKKVWEKLRKVIQTAGDWGSTL